MKIIRIQIVDSYELCFCQTKFQMSRDKLNIDIII
jgi:hypothetical protein